MRWSPPVPAQPQTQLCPSSKLPTGTTWAVTCGRCAWCTDAASTPPCSSRCPGWVTSLSTWNATRAQLLAHKRSRLLELVLAWRPPGGVLFLRPSRFLQGPPTMPSLRGLAKQLLGREIQNGAGHSSAEDAEAALRAAQVGADYVCGIQSARLHWWWPAGPVCLDRWGCVESAVVADC